MMAIRLALKQAKTFIHHSCIMISTDNTTVVSYINKQGGTHSPNLCVEVWKILNWCLEQDIVMIVRHIPSKFNILADHLSRLDKPIRQNGLWIKQLRIQNSRCSISQMWICSRHDSTTDSHYMSLQYKTTKH